MQTRCGFGVQHSFLQVSVLRCWCRCSGADSCARQPGFSTSFTGSLLLNTLQLLPATIAISAAGIVLTRSARQNGIAPAAAIAVTSAPRRRFDLANVLNNELAEFSSQAFEQEDCSL